MKRPTLPILLVASVGLSLILSSCSKPISPLDAASAVQVASVSQTGDQMLVGMMDPTSSLTPAALTTTALGTASLSPQVASACGATSYTETGWTTDSDGDGIPDDATTTYSCNAAGVTLTGTLNVQDKPGANTGYTVTIKGFKLAVTSAGQTSTVTLAMSFNLTESSGTAYGLVYDFDAGLDTPSGSGSISVSGTPTYTAANATTPFSAGTFTLDGQASFTGLGGKSYQLTRQSSGLSFDKATCTAGFDSGSVVYQDSRSHKATITYTGCDSGTVTFDGSQQSTF